MGTSRKCLRNRFERVMAAPPDEGVDAHRGILGHDGPASQPGGGGADAQPTARITKGVRNVAAESPLRFSVPFG